VTRSLEILLVEDSAEDALMIRSYLDAAGADCDIHRIETLSGAVGMLDTRQFDVILLDLGLPDSSGLATFARLQLNAGRTPIVVITALDDEATALRAVQAGADDYLIKGQVHATLLWRSLRYAIERRRAAQRIEFQAHLLDQVGQAVVATDVAGTIEYWNAAAQGLFGWTAEEAIGRAIDEIVPIVDGGNAEAVAAARLAQDRWTGEVAVRRRDGSRLFVASTLTTLRDDAGRVVGRIGVSQDVTERRLAENALRESEQRLRLFVDVMPTVLWTTDLDLRITSIRGAALERLSTGRNLIGTSVTEFVSSPRDVKSPEALQGAAVSTEVVWDGHTFDVHVEPLRAEDGTIVGTIGIALDVTEHRRSEREAAQYFELLGTVIDAAPVAIILVDESGMVSLWNRAAEELFGWQSSEVLGRPAPHVHPEDRSEFERARARVRHSGRPRKFPGRRVTKDGRMLDVMITTAAVHGPDGRYHGSLGIVEDVTSQRLGEERQQRLNAIIETSPDFVATFDVQRRTLFMNGAGRELVGLLPDDDATTTSLDSLCSAAGGEPLDRLALPVMIADGSWSGEALMRIKSGEEVLVWLTLVAHRRGDGDLAFISAVAQDITERRFLEEQLRQSQKMEAVGRLAGGIAHDFNNLLTAIAGHTELLLEDLGEDDGIRSDIEEVMRAVDRASTLTRQLLAFSRRQVLQPRLLDVNQVISDLGRLLHRLIGEDVSLQTSYDPDIGRIRADQGQVEQVVMNLVVNARDALPGGGVIEIRTSSVHVGEDSPEHRRGARPGDYAAIVVHDDGVGMDEAVLSRIFEPFFTTKEQGKGTGLGLPTAYGIVSQSGGCILVDSTLGIGSTFRVLFPEENGTPEEKPQVPAASEDNSGSEMILLVEDEVAVRRLGVRILERRGYNVLEAASGQEAVRLFEQMAPQIDMLVTDVVMPEMGGTELARRLRAMKPSLRVLFTSGYTADAIAHDGGLEDGTAFLEKPFTPEVLAQKVRDVLDDRHG
jgi:two-component system, cell cycle sensor histidine kinase and response regulator CckA